LGDSCPDVLADRRTHGRGAAKHVSVYVWKKAIELHLQNDSLQFEGWPGSKSSIQKASMAIAAAHLGIKGDARVTHPPTERLPEVVYDHNRAHNAELEELPYLLARGRVITAQDIGVSSG
jgi:hypothetical protein